MSGERAFHGLLPVRPAPALPPIVGDEGEAAPGPRTDLNDLPVVRLIVMGASLGTILGVFVELAGGPGWRIGGYVFAEVEALGGLFWAVPALVRHFRSVR